MEHQTDAVIGEGKVVAIYYTLKNDAGEVLDSNCRGGKPLAFMHGMRGIVAGLEKALGGKKKDDFVAVSVTPEEGYGLRREDLAQKILRSARGQDTALRDHDRRRKRCDERGVRAWTRVRAEGIQSLTLLAPRKAAANA